MALNHVHRERPVPPCLDHQLTRQGIDRRGLQRAQLHCPIQGISWHNLHTPESNSARLASSTCQAKTFLLDNQTCTEAVGRCRLFPSQCGPQFVSGASELGSHYMAKRVSCVKGATTLPASGRRWRGKRPAPGWCSAGPSQSRKTQ